MAETFLIVGAGLAGDGAAATLREEGFDGRVVLVGEERDPPYLRPPLSKEYLRDELPLAQTVIREPGFYERHEIDTRFGERAEAVDPTERRVRLGSGESLGYDKLLIATGGRNRRPPIPGLELAGVHDLRRVGDADGIRADATLGSRALVVGMGFIGCEVAASLRARGVEVTAVAPGRVPLSRVLGDEVGRVLEGVHRDNGVTLMMGDTVEAFEGGSRVERAVTKSGKEIRCDFAVVGLGIEPDADLVADAGVEVENGIMVDERCRTNVEGIYAAGDVANHRHPVFDRHLRVEHWDHARRHGPAAARSMLGREEAFDDVPWFWSDQYDADLQYAGFAAEWDEVVVRGSLEERKFAAFYVKDGRVDATVAMSRWRDARAAETLIHERSAVDPALLRDDDVDLRGLANRRS